MPVLAPPPNTILDEFPPPKILDVEIPLTPAVVGASLVGTVRVVVRDADEVAVVVGAVGTEVAAAR